jgi:hypothetical protein
MCASRPVYWLGSLDRCQTCRQDFNGVMYDAAIARFGGQWANICQECFDAHVCRLGLGRGQKYEQQDDGKWLKVGG